MSGGISQLIAVGAQDVHLTSNPEISFFRSVYKRHTNFSHCMSLEQISGNPTNNGMTTVNFKNKGDLLGYVYLMALSTDNTTVQKLTGNEWMEIIDSVELLIGGQVIDKQESKFSEIIAVDTLAQNLSRSALGSHHNGGAADTYFYPLRFSFFENWQSALPLVSLQYHDVTLRINWKDIKTYNYQVIADYIYLDTEERTFFAENEQTMLIYQVQKASASNSKVNDLFFNHPVKFIASSNTASGNFFTNTNKVKLQINGVDVNDFMFVVPTYTQSASYYHCPYSVGNEDDFFLYPFCLDTSRIQPTGSLNFSRLDSARIISETETITDDFYAVNYNILKIKNGMGGLMYSD